MTLNIDKEQIVLDGAFARDLESLGKVIRNYECNSIEKKITIILETGYKITFIVEDKDIRITKPSVH